MRMKIEILPVFRIHIAVPVDMTFGTVMAMIHECKGDIAHQPPRTSFGEDVWSLAIDFKDPADRNDFSKLIQDTDIRSIYQVSIHVPTTLR